MSHRGLQISSPAPSGTRRPRRRGFTLTELLVVMGIIVLIAIVAVPSFRALTGGRSTEAAHNQLAGVLGRARSEAIGLQQVRGIAFFIDPESRRVQAVMVKQTDAPPPPTGPAAPVQPDVFLDMVEDRDPVLMPNGVGVQMVDDCALAAGANTTADYTDDVRGDDAYIGLNRATVNTVPIEYGGVILFDGYGRIVSKSYAFKFFLVTSAADKRSNLGKAFGMPTTSSADFRPTGPPRSQFGFVVYDQEAFDNLGFTAGDPQIDTSVTGGYADNATNDASRSPEAREERWIDANATPILVNRNNGTLVKGE